MNFSVSDEYIYFDSAKSSGMYSELLNWRTNHDKLLLEKGSQFRSNHKSFIDELRTELDLFLLKSLKKFSKTSA